MRKNVFGNFAFNGNCMGLVLCVSCICRDASRDCFGVVGISMNDGRRCGACEKFLVANRWLHKIS